MLPNFRGCKSRCHRKMGELFQHTVMVQPVIFPPSEALYTQVVTDGSTRLRPLFWVTGFSHEFYRMDAATCSIVLTYIISLAPVGHEFNWEQRLQILWTPADVPVADTQQIEYDHKNASPHSVPVPAQIGVFIFATPSELSLAIEAFSTKLLSDDIHAEHRYHFLPQLGMAFLCLPASSIPSREQRIPIVWAAKTLNPSAPDTTLAVYVNSVEPRDPLGVHTWLVMAGFPGDFIPMWRNWSHRTNNPAGPQLVLVTSSLLQWSMFRNHSEDLKRLFQQIPLISGDGEGFVSILFNSWGTSPIHHEPLNPLLPYPMVEISQVISEHLPGSDEANTQTQHAIDTSLQYSNIGIRTSSTTLASFVARTSKSPTRLGANRQLHASPVTQRQMSPAPINMPLRPPQEQMFPPHLRNISRATNDARTTFGAPPVPPPPQTPNQTPAEQSRTPTEDLDGFSLPPGSMSERAHGAHYQSGQRMYPSPFIHQGWAAHPPVQSEHRRRLSVTEDEWSILNGLRQGNLHVTRLDDSAPRRSSPTRAGSPSKRNISEIASPVSSQIPTSSGNPLRRDSDSEGEDAEPIL